ncbi:MAG: peptide deformylase [Candidatus Pacebacteria bacterium]|nr:peptide deformylase [Candidatus Paceibacterota bacterium]
MATIVQKDSPVLRVVADPVNPKDFGTPLLKKIIESMKTSLEKEEDGVAIAAPQIGVPLRIFVVSHRAFEYASEEDSASPNPAPENIESGGLSAPPKRKYKRKDMVFINPEIIKLSRKKVWVPEGCLSVRWLYGEVSRADKATVRAYDENGKLFTRGGSGLIAQIFQHENDHLNGILFTDNARRG